MADSSGAELTSMTSQSILPEKINPTLKVCEHNRVAHASMALQKRLESLSAQVATFFSDVEVRMLDATVDVSELRPLLAKIKGVAVEQLSVKYNEEKNLLSRFIEQERIHKREFDQRVAAWFEQRGCKDWGETSSWREDQTTRAKMSIISTSRISSHSHSTAHSKTSILVKRGAQEAAQA